MVYEVVIEATVEAGVTVAVIDPKDMAKERAKVPSSTAYRLLSVVS